MSTFAMGLYNLTRRALEYALIPQCEELGMPAMAYSPIEQGRRRL